MKRYLGILAVFLIGITSNAQDTSWQLYSTVEGVEIYSMETDCYAKDIPAQKAVLIKVVNTTNSKIKIEWDRVIWYNDKLVTKDVADGENHMTVEVAGNGTVEGDCEVPYGALYLYKDFITYKADIKLTKFELRNLKVTRL